ncbi:MAG: prepilin peptidase [Helicobacteraceae bacterium]|jgi:leader peptidase (prepilin peptidase)/N-methyltransferase|nr:prepilin peptidase [Helicobacteraceae bacterium]
MEWFFIIIVGLCFGSFANVLIVRLPSNESIAFPASHCPKCKHKLRIYHNIPLLSYIFLGGKCAFCKKPISIVYPLVELSSAIIFTLIFYKLGITVFAIFTSLAFLLLLVLSIIDMKTLMASDSVNFSALAFAIFSSGSFVDNATNALLLAGALSLLRMGLSSLLKKEAMGEGDIILGATMGALLGAKGALLALFIAALAALLPALYNRRNNQAETPFIPYLSFGTLVVFIFEQRLFDLLGW